jgi:Glu-tRNA(Gln) amidotransferase subunit E-like FAD-binding protein
VRDPHIVPQTGEHEPAELDEELPEAGTTFALPTPGRERMYGTFDGIPPQASTARNLAARRRVIE